MNTLALERRDFVYKHKTITRRSLAMPSVGFASSADSRVYSHRRIASNYSVGALEYNIEYARCLNVSSHKLTLFCFQKKTALPPPDFRRQRRRLVLAAKYTHALHSSSRGN